MQRNARSWISQSSSEYYRRAATTLPPNVDPNTTLSWAQEPIICLRHTLWRNVVLVWSVAELCTAYRIIRHLQTVQRSIGETLDLTPLLKHFADLIGEGSPTPKLYVDDFMSVVKQIMNMAEALTWTCTCVSCAALRVAA